ncbi:molybdopterin-dependent oxidoreductase [Archangium sp.]|uniref:molybdopterin-dependent oxidoreductase n=1 Tax=Archangium sp. TaxID=1872627 RepID=UPI00286CE7F9|nr:molybdopterin-dependent oxidoreductase [Archangium sp.]
MGFVSRREWQLSQDTRRGWPRPSFCTRKTRTSGFCDHVLRFKPNSDLAIACGIAHLLVENGTYDKAFVEAHCAFRAPSTPATLEGKAITFEEYRALLKPYTPEKVEQLSGVSAKDLRMLADLFGRRDVRITSLWCMGMNQHTRGTAINNLVHGLHLLSGHFGKPGDAPTSLTGQPSACGTVREVGTLAHALPGGRVVAKAEHRAQREGAFRPAGSTWAPPWRWRSRPRGTSPASASRSCPSAPLRPTLMRGGPSALRATASCARHGAGPMRACTRAPSTRWPRSPSR